MTILLGADISLNHGAFVALEANSLTFAPKVRVISQTPGHGPYHLNKELRGVRRLARLRELIATALAELQPSAVTIEDYSYASKHQAHQLGEIGGVLRLELHCAGIPYVAIDPCTNKKFLTGKGNAQKPAMIAAALEESAARGQALFSPKDYNASLREDCADAYALVRILEACTAPTKYDNLSGRQALLTTNRDDGSVYSRVRAVLEQRAA